MNNQVSALNPYALDYPTCVAASVRQAGRAQRVWLYNHINGHRSIEERKALGIPLKDAYEPCADDYADVYLNRADVKAAIHVKDSIKWASCSNTIKYSTTDSLISTAPIYNYLIDGGYKLNILVYSGDDDSVCGTIGTQDWIWDLGYNVSGKQWQTYVVNNQLAGFLTKWTNTKLAFLTVHGAGHEVI